MDRRLIVMRHAKSSWNSDAADDHARPLKPRGRRDAAEVAGRLVELGWNPQRVLSSDSQRTRETYQCMCGAWGEAAEVVFLPSLYDGGVASLFAALGTLPDDVTTVLVLGHNPGWSEVVTWLSGRGAALKTADAALLEGQGDTWREALAIAGAWTLREVVHAK